MRQALSINVHIHMEIQDRRDTTNGVIYTLGQPRYTIKHFPNNFRITKIHNDVDGVAGLKFVVL